MKKQGNGVSAAGRTPPPAARRFPKGRSGNPGGRPKGSISLDALTRKVAMKKHRVEIDGRLRKFTMLELQIMKLNAMAASGQPAAATLMSWLRAQVEPSSTEVAKGGFLLVSAPVTPEEFMAEEEVRNVGKLEPGTFVDVKHEEFMKAVRGEESPLGEAIQSFHKKYG